MYDSSPLLSKPPDPGNSNASGGKNASAEPPLCPRSVWSGFDFLPNFFPSFWRASSRVFGKLLNELFEFGSVHES
jgi:hypothetical protein